MQHRADMWIVNGDNSVTFKINTGTRGRIQRLRLKTKLMIKKKVE